MDQVIVNEVLPMPQDGSFDCGKILFNGESLEQTQSKDSNGMLAIKTQQEYGEENGRNACIEEGQLHTLQYKPPGGGMDDMCQFGTPSKSKPENRTFKCAICSEKFNSSFSFQRHIQCRAGELCNICGKECCHKLDLSEHLKTHRNDTPANAKEKETRSSCDICGKTFGCASSMLRHKRIHTDSRPYKCVICLKRFTEMNDLTKHHRSHTGEHKYKCDVCAKGFDAKTCYYRHLEMHKRKQQSEIGAKATSDISSGKVTSHANFSAHAHKTFNERDDLTNHLKIHDGKNKYRCDICGKGFDLKGSLNRHLQTHRRQQSYHTPKSTKRAPQSGRDPFTCNMCNKTFDWNFSFRRHMKMHSEEKPYSCGICGKRFYDKNYYNRHMKAHERSMQYTNSGTASLKPVEDEDIALQQELTVPKNNAPLNIPQKDVDCGENIRKIIQPLPTTPQTTMSQTQNHSGGTNESQRHDTVMVTKEDSTDDVGGKVISSSDSLQAHAMIKNEEIELPCSSEYSVKSCIDTHSKIKENPFKLPFETHTEKVDAIVAMSTTEACNIKCNACEEHFAIKTVYAKHMLEHTRDRPYKCVLCSGKFFSVRDLRKHVEVHLANENKQYTCNDCGKTYHEYSRLVEHCNTHAVGTTHIAQTARIGDLDAVCGKTCTDIQNIQSKNPKSKRTTRAEMNQFTCDICQRTFCWLQSFRRHMRMHTGENPFICDICGKGYYEGGDLNRHIKTHTN